MGYLDNSVITVDAILTKRGRELLAQNDGSFRITQFALGDDEVDYTLFNENHPNGTQYAGEAIENMPLLEAMPDETNMMRHKLVTLPRGTSKLPVVTANVSMITLTIGGETMVSPTTLNFDGSNNQAESGYIFEIADRRLFTNITIAQAGTDTGGNAVSMVPRTYTSTAVSKTMIGRSLGLKALSSTSLFGANTKLLTTLTIEGVDSGARTTVPVEISKQVIASTSPQGQTGIMLR
jgi:hypothetical protein